MRLHGARGDGQLVINTAAGHVDISTDIGENAGGFVVVPANVLSVPTEETGKLRLAIRGAELHQNGVVVAAKAAVNGCAGGLKIFGAASSGYEQGTGHTCSYRQECVAAVAAEAS